MSVSSPNVGVRVFPNLANTVASIDTRDSTVIGMALPAPNVSNEGQIAFPANEPVRVSTDDAATIAKLGAGVAADTFAQIASEGIVTDVVFVRVAHSAEVDTQMGYVVGDATAKTGLWALLSAKDALGIEPGVIIAPGYTSQRLGGDANPAASAIDAICERIIDCIGVVDTPSTNREAAAEYAADFATSLNMLAMYPSARVFIGGQKVTRPISPHVAAAIVRNDKANGNPFKAFWNKGLKGVLSPSQAVTYFDGRTEHDANFLNFAGVGTVIEGKLLWSPFSTATDPTVINYRSIKRIRTRRSIEKAIPRALRMYAGQDLGPHLVTLIATALSEKINECVAAGALIDGEIVFPKALNQPTSLRDGELRLRFRSEETPELVDLQIDSEPMPEAYDTLISSIEGAIAALGDPNIRVAA